MKTTDPEMKVTARHKLAVLGTILGAELRNAMKALGYCPAAIADAIDHVGASSTARGSEAIDAEDVEVLEALIIRHTEFTEFESSEDWPDWCDSDLWTSEPEAPEPDDETPPTGEEHEPDELWNRAGEFTPYEPTEAERLWLATNGDVDVRSAEALAAELMSRGLMPFDFHPAPVSGGAPAESRADRLGRLVERVKVRREAAYQDKDRFGHGVLDQRLHRLEAAHRRARKVVYLRPMSPITDRDVARSGSVG